jgi:hypothetical protein
MDSLSTPPTTPRRLPRLTRQFNDLNMLRGLNGGVPDANGVPVADDDPAALIPDQTGFENLTGVQNLLMNEFWTPKRDKRFHGPG